MDDVSIGLRLAATLPLPTPALDGQKEATAYLSAAHVVVLSGNVDGLISEPRSGWRSSRTHAQHVWAARAAA